MYFPMFATVGFLLSCIRSYSNYDINIRCWRACQRDPTATGSVQIVKNLISPISVAWLDRYVTDEMEMRDIGHRIARDAPVRRPPS